ncbi:hypothetical protein R2F61_08650 [Mollicutes bacterium LVI A0078]|nr:hypothetical protein RZE84_08425 [Mollicutes bacterium LVI A0075]WOO90771.1 hypothetical protein R2F61_08650 [Mollicutes bacterium LVI A0078]
MSKRKNKKKKRSKKYSKVKYKKHLQECKLFYFAIVIIFLILTILIIQNQPVTGVSNRGLKLLNSYEFPNYLVESGSCMRPYDVGDGVVTFGPGITYQTAQEGITDINNLLNKQYTTEDNCIKERDLKKLQTIKLTRYENKVFDLANVCNLLLNQDQFDGLLLIAYNSPLVLENTQFKHAVCNQQPYQEYVDSAHNYYKQLRGYEQLYGEGWYNRIVDSAEMYYYGDYKYQNKLGE